MATIVSTLIALPPARADALVDVLLKGATDGGDVSGMEMIAAPDHVKAGRVTIHASNQSHGLVHEVIVVRLLANDADRTGCRRDCPGEPRFPSLNGVGREHGGADVELLIPHC